MFRTMRRIKQQVSKEKCIEILKNEWRGVLAVLGDDGYPYTVPLDFYYDEGDGNIYFHCAKVGHKIDALATCNKVSFCVMDKGFKKDGDWAFYITSVVVFGKITPVTDVAKIKEKVCALAAKYNPDSRAIEKEWEGAQNRVLCLELSIDYMTGKCVHEK